MKTSIWFLLVALAVSPLQAQEMTNLIDILRRFQDELDSRTGSQPARPQPATPAQPSANPKADQPIAPPTTPTTSPASQPALAVDPQPQAVVVRPTTVTSPLTETNIINVGPVSAPAWPSAPTNTTPAVVEAPATTPPQSDPQLKAGDLIRVTVVDEPDMSAERVRVAADGTVLMPIVGPVPVAGRTIPQAAESIREILARDYLVRPVVEIQRLQGLELWLESPSPETNPAPNSLHDSAPQLPQLPSTPVPRTPPDSAPDASPQSSAQAWPVTPAATPIDPAPLAAEPPAAVTTTNNNPNPPADVASAEIAPQPSPTATEIEGSVPETAAQSVLVIRDQVSQPGTYSWPRNEPMTIWRAIGRAGGLTRHADATRVRVRRQIDGLDRELVFDLEALKTDPQAAPPLLKSGDVIEVPSK